MNSDQLNSEIVDAVANAFWPLENLSTDEARNELRADATRAVNAAYPHLVAEVERLTERNGSLLLDEPSKTAGLYAAVDELQRELERLREAGIRVGMYRFGLDRKTAAQMLDRELAALDEESQ